MFFLDKDKVRFCETVEVEVAPNILFLWMCQRHIQSWSFV